MVGIMNSKSRVRLASLAKSAKSAVDLPFKLDRLRRLRHELPENGAGLSSALLPLLSELLSDSFGAVRKFVTQLLGEIALKHPEYLPEIVPVLVDVLKDATPAVARQAITSGTDLFGSTLKRVALQGLRSSELETNVEASWEWMLKFKDEIFSLAREPGSGGVRLLAMKFVEKVILLYTPDPSGSTDAPQEGSSDVFNISFLRGGHPVLKVGDLSIEASQKLVFLLDQLRHPSVKSLSGSAIIVLINSLSSIAEKRPAYYGRVLPVLLSLDPPSFVKGVHVAAICRALKGVFHSFLNCTHPAAAPWRDRLADALRQMEIGESAEETRDEVCKTNGNMLDKDNALAVEDKKPFVSSSDAAQTNISKKRSGSENSSDLGDDLTSKRRRPAPSSLGGSAQDLDENVAISQPDVGGLSTLPNSNSGGSDTGPAQQLVTMFGALVAQGEKAIGSLEILISSISTNLLADVVMANMHNIPHDCPQAEGNDELVANMSIVGSETQVKYPPSFLAGVLSLSNSFPPIASMLESSLPAKEEREEELQPNNALDMTIESEDVDMATDLPNSLEVFCVREVGDVVFTSDVQEVGSESEIPGLISTAKNFGVENSVTSSLPSTDMEDASQVQLTSFAGKSTVEVDPSISTDRSEEFSQMVPVLGSNSLATLTATSTAVPAALVLPKISAPLVELADEEKDNVQKLAFARIVDAYKQITVSGGSQLRFSLLAHLGVEFPLELDPWELLREHILSDYLHHEGHELTVRVLYRLYGEAEEEHDFFSSTTAASVYETFLLTVAEALRDSFPPSDKSISRLLGDAPHLPKSVLKFLESLCCPGNSENVAEKDVQSGDRVTQGLSAVWSLILLRPGIRDVSLKIALQSTVNHLEEVRMKAIRLVANKLFPLSYIAQQIEDFARDKLLSVTSNDTKDRASNGLNESQKDKPSNELETLGGMSKDTSSDTSVSFAEAQQFMSLYFALCTKKHSLFRQIFNVYKGAPEVVKQVIHRQIPILVRTMGSSSVLLEIISDPSSGSENLLMQVLQTLTDGAPPSSELIFTIRKLFDAKVKDVEILFPVLPFLPRDELLHIFPHLVNLPMEKFQVALSRVLQGSPPSGPVLSPAEVLIAIHGIQPERDGIPLKKVTDACNVCFEQRQIFTQQVLAGVLNQLVEQIPLPLLFMRTVLQAIGAYPALVGFILDILGRLVSKQIWRYPKLWVGFLKCAQLTQPQSFKVLLQLPPPQLENALNRVSALKPPLVSYASQPDIESSLPRSILVVLGLASDSQAQKCQTQISHSQTSQAQASESQLSQAETTQTEETPTETKPQISQAEKAQIEESETQTKPQMSQGETTQTEENQTETKPQVSQAETSQTEENQTQTKPQISEAEPTQTEETQTQTSPNEETQTQTSPQVETQIQTSPREESQTETSPMETIDALASDAQASSHAEASQAEGSDSQATSRSQASPAQTAGSASSQNEMETEKSKESSTTS